MLETDSFDGVTNHTSLHFHFVNYEMRLITSETTNFVDICRWLLGYRSNNACVMFDLFAIFMKKFWPFCKCIVRWSLTVVNRIWSIKKQFLLYIKWNTHFNVETKISIIHPKIRVHSFHLNFLYNYVDSIMIMRWINIEHC
jgi:hypothetical protein